MRGIEYDTGIISSIKHVSFDDSQDWETWHAVLEDHDIQVPEPKTAYLEVPGRNGTLDYSEAVSGVPVFNDRTITMQFAFVDPIESNRIEDSNTFINDIHGQRKKIVFDYLDGYFTGRCVCEKKIENDGQRIVVTVTATCYPLRLLGESRVTSDTVTFRSSEIHGDTVSVTVDNSGISIVPTIVVTGQNIGRIALKCHAEDSSVGKEFTIYGLGNHGVAGAVAEHGRTIFEFTPSSVSRAGGIIGGQDATCSAQFELICSREVL